MIEPSYSPWGSVDHCRMLCYGAFEVQTARHGGVMILCQLADEYLSKEAQEVGFVEGQYLCFEEDCDAQVALRELLDKKLISKAFNLDAEQLGEIVNQSLKQWHPEYWQAREKALAQKEKEHSSKPVQHSMENSH